MEAFGLGKKRILKQDSQLIKTGTVHVRALKQLLTPTEEVILNGDKTTKFKRGVERDRTLSKVRPTREPKYRALSGVGLLD